MWLEIIFLGLGVARVIEWVKEIFGHPIWYPQIKNWPGRPSKMLMNIFGSALATYIWAPPNWHQKVIFFLGVSAIATTAHSLWSTLWQVRMHYRLDVRDRVARATRPTRRT